MNPSSLIASAGMICLWAVMATKLWAGDLPLEGIVVMLDPGHAVINARGTIINSGGKGHGIIERDCVLAISERAAELLVAQGARVYQTRTGSAPWRVHENSDEDNYARAFEALACEADAFVRIHLDWSKKAKAKGTRTFYLRREHEAFALCIQRNVVRAAGRKNLGIEQNWFKGLEEVTMPTVLLEACFMSNQSDAQALAKPSFLDAVAQGIADGVVEYFSPGSGPVESAAAENLPQPLP